MIQYKYNLLKDIKNLLNNHGRKEFFSKEGIIYFPPSFKRFLAILFEYYTGKIAWPEITTSEEMICYVVTSGTWGAYESPNKIFILPWKLEKMEQLNGIDLKGLIEHEIAHLELEGKKDLTGIRHREKEDLVSALIKSKKK